MEDYYNKQKKLLNFEVASGPGETWKGLLAALHLQHLNIIDSSSQKLTVRAALILWVILLLVCSAAYSKLIDNRVFEHFFVPSFTSFFFIGIKALLSPMREKEMSLSCDVVCRRSDIKNRSPACVTH